MVGVSRNRFKKKRQVPMSESDSKFVSLAARTLVLAEAVDAVLASAPRGAMPLVGLAIAVLERYPDLEADFGSEVYKEKGEDGTDREVGVGIMRSAIQALLDLSVGVPKDAPHFAGLRKVGVVRGDLYEKGASASVTKASKVLFTGEQFLAILAREGVPPDAQIRGFVSLGESRDSASLIAGLRGSGIPDARVVSIVQGVLAAKRGTT